MSTERKGNRAVMAIAGLFALLLAGMIYSWSIFARSIGADFPEWGSTKLSTIFTLLMAFFCIGIFICGFLSKKVSPGRIMWLGAACLFAGFALASRAESVGMLILGFSMLCGAGSGLAYNAVIATVTKWFPDKKGFISGLLLMAFGFSGFLVGKLFQAYTPQETGGWRGSFLVMGIVCAVVIAIAGMFVKAPEAGGGAAKNEGGAAMSDAAKNEGGATMSDAAKNAGGATMSDATKNEGGATMSDAARNAGGAAMSAAAKNESGADGGAAPAGHGRKTDYTPREMVASPKFWLYYIWTVALSMAGLVLIAQAGGAAAATVPTYTGSAIATVVGLISIANGGGRIVVGWIFDKVGRATSMNIINIAFIISAVALTIALRSGSSVLLIAGFILLGFGYGGAPVCNAAFVSSAFGLKNYSMNLPVVNTCLLAASVGSTISGAIYEATSSYGAIYLFMAALAIAGGLCGNIIVLIERKESR